MPMDKDNTPSIRSLKKNRNHSDADKPQVSEKTLMLLRAFARNYYIEKKLPNELQGIILG